MFLIPALVIKWISPLIKPINEFAEIVAPEIDEDTVTTFFETPIRSTPVMNYSRISFSRVGGFIEQDDGPLDDKLFDNVGGGGTSNAAARGPVGGAPAGGGGLGSPNTGTGTGGSPAGVSTPHNTTYSIIVSPSTGGGVPIPSGWISYPATNGKGMVYQDPKSLGLRNQNTIRVMEGTSQYPNGYIRIYNQNGQPVNQFNRPGSPSETHLEFGMRFDPNHNILR
jgi:hypothetical protein